MPANDPLPSETEWRSSAETYRSRWVKEGPASIALLGYELISPLFMDRRPTSWNCSHQPLDEKRRERWNKLEWAEDGFRALGFINERDSRRMRTATITCQSCGSISIGSGASVQVSCQRDRSTSLDNLPWFFLYFVCFARDDDRKCIIRNMSSRLI